MIHVILAARLIHAQDYIHKLGLEPSKCRTVCCSIPSDGDRLRGLTDVVIHRTQSWYRAPLNREKNYIQLCLSSYVEGRGKVRAVINEVNVVNTTFMS